MREHKIELPTEVPLQSVVGYARLFQLENWLRELVYLETKAHFGKDWWTVSEEALSRSGAQIIPADKSLTQDKRHRHMATPENDPLWYLSFGSVLKIMSDKQLWPIFECYLTTKELLEAKFSEILPIRNRSGHNRILHEDDLDRIRRLLRDLDQGFWRFCSSFNDKHPFMEDLRTDAVYQNFKERMGIDFVEVGPNRWAQVGRTDGMRQNVMVMYSFRPSAADKSRFPAKGGLYHFIFSLTPNSRRSLDYRKILESSQSYHRMTAYIILDSFQSTLRLSIPALYSAGQIIEAAECFYDACGKMLTISYRDHVTTPAEDDPFSEYEAFNRPFQAIASEWPHYVIPPGHPFEVLSPDCPCRFFEA
jgi:hypothetical protein